MGQWQLQPNSYSTIIASQTSNSMAQTMKTHLLPILLLMLMAIVEATPPGVAKSPSNARCSIKKYKYCYNLKLVCPKSCPRQCTVDCVSCKSICVGAITIIMEITQRETE